MNLLVWAGTLVSLAGLAGLIACIAIVARAKRSGLDDLALREKLKGVMPLNLAALFVSALGLMMVVLGIVLG